MSDRYVLGFEEVDRRQVTVVGGKGANLGELSRLDGVHVPSGLCVATDVFRWVMAQAPSLDDLLDRLSRLGSGPTARMDTSRSFLAEADQMTDPTDGCAHAPFTSPEQFGSEHLGGGDKGSEASVLTCRTCGGLWLKVLVEWEHHSRSGRWWLVPVEATEREAITAQDAVAIVEGSAWGYEGGSFYDGVVQRREGPLTVF